MGIVKTFREINNKNDERIVQVKVLPRKVVEGHGEGTIYWVTPNKARVLCKLGAVQVLNNTLPPEEEVGKSSDARSNGPSTDSASSTQHGQEKPLSALGVAPPSTRANAEGLPVRRPRGAAESSQSIPPTGAAPEPTSSTSPTQDGGDNTTKPRSTRRSRGRSAA